MANYAGAIAALRTAFAAAWAAAYPAVPIAYPNTIPPAETWPPIDGSGAPVPWVYFEVIGNGAALRSCGAPGSLLWLYKAHIFVHVFVPADYGTDDAEAFAVAAGEIFRAQTFYQDGAGAKIICYAPQTDGGAKDADNGNQWRITCSIPFEYYHHG
jgi:hypothetical protein